MSKPIVVVGSSNIDLVMKMDRLPKRDESVPNADFFQAYGGKGANQAVAAARAGGDVYFINCVGDDPYAKAMVESYRASGVHTDYIFTEEGISSGTALIMIGEGGHNYLSVAPGSNYLLTPERIDEVRPTIENAAYILMQFEIRAETVQYVLTLAREAGVPVIWNVAPAQEFDRTWLESVEIVVANEPEAEMITGIKVDDRESGGAAAIKLVALGASIAIVTLGENGSVIATGDSVDTDKHNRFTHVAAYPVEPVDTTAAGDTYCGCLATALAEGMKLDEAIRFAGAAAALSVQKMGAQPSTPWRKEIDTFLANGGRND